MRYYCALLLFVWSTCGLAQEATPAHKDSLLKVVNEYYDLNLLIFSADSEPQDIDKLFSMFTVDFEYHHQKYGGNYSRQNLYEGYLRNQARGGYDGSIVDVRIYGQIPGLNAVAVERAYIQRSQEGLKTEVDRGLTLFEFRDGQISRIVEYW